MPSHEDIATRLRDAYAGGAVAPLRDALEPADADGAYAVQTINTRYWEAQGRRIVGRSEEHTSELQSLMRISYAVFCLKKKNKNKNNQQHHTLHKISIESVSKQHDMSDHKYNLVRITTRY